MYWPSGSASRLSLSSTLTGDSPTSSQGSNTNYPPTSDELIGITHCSQPTPDAPFGLFATWTATELTIWNPKPKIAISKLVRTQDSLSRLGLIHDVKWKPDKFNLTLVVWTVKSTLIAYALEPLPKSSSVYNLPADQSSSFLATGPAERIPLPKLLLKLIGEISPIDPSEQISCLELTPNQIIIGISGPTPQLKATSWSSLHHFFSSASSINTSPQHRFHRLVPKHQLHNPQPNPASSNYPHLRQYFLSNFYWLINGTHVRLVTITYSSELNLYVFVTSDGRGYMVHSTIDAEVKKTSWIGSCFHEPIHQLGRLPATGACAINFRFNLVALGLQKGIVDVYSIGNSANLTNLSHSLNIDQEIAAQDVGNTRGFQEGVEPVVNNCTWASDGFALAVSRSDGFSVWSVFGRLQFSSYDCLPNQVNLGNEIPFEDYFMNSCKSLFWGPGNFELFLLSTPTDSSPRYISDDQLFVLPFAKSAVATLHSPDNTKHALLQLDDRISVYSGMDCTDMSLINPGSDVWQQVKIPADYISTNWPIELSCISDDGLLLAVAGKRGFTHFNLVSGRWKLFENEDEEQSIHVVGGMQWFGSLLVTGIEEVGLFSIRLFARENPLSLSQCLFEHAISHPIVLLSIYETSLLVYTADNTLYHFIIKDQKLIECGTIGFEGVIGNPLRARGMSWLIPHSQHCFGEPENDLNFATIIFLIDGKIVLLSPKKSEASQVRYDLQILADRIEFYWTGRQFNSMGCSNLLQDSLWAWDGKKILLWLDVLSINHDNILPPDQDDHHKLENKLAQSMLTIPLNFHPLSVLVDKGIILGIEQETVIKKSLKFAFFRIITNTQLFIHQVIKLYLSKDQMDAAVEFGRHYSNLVYFGHSLEILLHDVLEEQEDELDHLSKATRRVISQKTSNGFSLTPSPSTKTNKILAEETVDRKVSLLPSVVQFLEHFHNSLEVVVSCARKIDVKQWKKLFIHVGKPRELFERCLDLGLLNVACSYLLVLNHYYLDDIDHRQLNHRYSHPSPPPPPPPSSSSSLPSSSKSVIEKHPVVAPVGDQNNKRNGPSGMLVVDDHYSIDIILSDTIRLYNMALEVKNWALCKELMRFLFSLDNTGKLLTKMMHPIRSP